MTRKRILVVDDETNVVKMCTRALQGAGFEAEGVFGGTEAIERCQKEAFDLLLIDLRMPDLGGLEVLRAIRELDPDMVAIIITGYGTFESVVEAMSLGAQEYLNKPFDSDGLVAAVQQVLARNFRPVQMDGMENRPMKKVIIAVDDESDIRTLVCFCLESSGDFEVLEAESGEKAIDLAIAHRPVLIVMDIRMPGMGGIEACRRLKADPATASIPVIFLSAWQHEAQAALDAGGMAFLLKPFDPEELIATVQKYANGTR